ncbi:MAG TPA: DUF6142 family protein [Pyrinomonadaceae bacterium]
MSRKNSGLGIASVLIGILTPLFIISLFIFSLSLDAFLNGYQQQDSNLILGLLIISVPPLSHFVGLILGVAGVRQTERKKLFPVLGIIINGLFLLSAGVLVVLIILILFKSLGSFH